jgi:hypothetical protein
MPPAASAFLDHRNDAKKGPPAAKGAALLRDAAQDSRRMHHAEQEHADDSLFHTAHAEGILETGAKNIAANNAGPLDEEFPPADTGATSYLESLAAPIFSKAASGGQLEQASEAASFLEEDEDAFWMGVQSSSTTGPVLVEVQAPYQGTEQAPPTGIAPLAHDMPAPWEAPPAPTSQPVQAATVQAVASSEAEHAQTAAAHDSSGADALMWQAQAAVSSEHCSSGVADFSTYSQPLRQAQGAQPAAESGPGSALGVPPQLGAEAGIQISAGEVECSAFGTTPFPFGGGPAAEDEDASFFDHLGQTGASTALMDTFLTLVNTFASLSFCFSRAGEE